MLENSGFKNHTLKLPKKNEAPAEIETSNSFLFVGANGSGKTRLGAWIEFDSGQASRAVHRISAQKSLAMPDSSMPKSIDLAENDLLFGIEKGEAVHKKPYRWNLKPSNHLLNDFEKLMVYLFSDETEASAKFKADAKKTDQRVEPPTTKMDQVKKLWETILPHRQLIIGGLKIETALATDASKIYNASEMSDGERVIFYLIGQCLAAKENSIIVIDEPELHLHKSVQNPLWSEIERLRADSFFIYLTHDVDFAAAKKSAKKIWLKSFDGSAWDWEELQPDEHIPENLLIEVLGNRKNVVFVEGSKESYDSALYSAILNNFLVIPVGSCHQVITSVKALKANTQFHHLQVFGIVDRDRRGDNEIGALKEEGVFVLAVAEVENLFCTREILEFVSKKLERNVREDFSKISEAIFNRCEAELETQISQHVTNEIKFELSQFDGKKKSTAGLASFLQAIVSEEKISALDLHMRRQFRTALEEKNYEQLLKLYNRKNIFSAAEGVLGLKKDALPEFVIRCAKNNDREAITSCLKKYLGGFEEFIELTVSLK